MKFFSKDNQTDVLDLLCFIYVYIPVTIFLLLWTKPFIAAICMIAIGIAGYSFFGKMKAAEFKMPQKKTILVFVFVALFLAWICYYAGYGRFTNQASDWNKHNAVLFDLIHKEWPVYYHNGNEYSMLTYYIGQYIVPALVGKVAHSERAAEITILVWNFIGLLLVWLNIVDFLKIKKSIMKIGSAIMMCFFGPPLWLAQYLLKHFMQHYAMGSGSWLIQNPILMLQYSHNFSLLRWVFPQVIVIWLLILVFLKHKSNLNYYCFILFPMLLFGSFPFFGMALIALIYAGYLVLTDKSQIKNVLSFENICVCVTLGFVLLLYFWGNISGEKPDTVAFKILIYSERSAVYFAFISQIVLYYIVLFKEYKDNLFFHLIAYELMIFPLFTMGVNNDFVMRASIPALFILMLFVIRFFNDAIEKQDMNRLCSATSMAVIVLVLIGLFYSFGEFHGIVASENYYQLGENPPWDSMEAFADRNIRGVDSLKYNYYAYDLNENYFYRYIARKK